MRITMMKILQLEVVVSYVTMLSLMFVVPALLFCWIALISRKTFCFVLVVKKTASVFFDSKTSKQSAPLV